MHRVIRLRDLVRTRAATLHSPLDARELNLPEPFVKWLGSG